MALTKLMVPGKDLKPGGAKRAGGDVSDLLARLWAQVDKLMAELEAAPLAPKDQAAVLAILARITPQLVAAERQYQMAVDGRDLSMLTNDQLKALVQAHDSR